MKSWKTTAHHATERRLVEILQIDAVESDAPPQSVHTAGKSKLDQSGSLPDPLGPTSARCSPGVDGEAKCHAKALRALFGIAENPHLCRRRIPCPIAASARVGPRVDR